MKLFSNTDEMAGSNKLRRQSQQGMTNASNSNARERATECTDFVDPVFGLVLLVLLQQLHDVILQDRRDLCKCACGVRKGAFNSEHVRMNDDGFESANCCDKERTQERESYRNGFESERTQEGSNLILELPAEAFDEIDCRSVTAEEQKANQSNSSVAFPKSQDEN